eukprot:6196651-Pleurochrysis_carterae.AAC.3
MHLQPPETAWRARDSSLRRGQRARTRGYPCARTAARSALTKQREEEIGTVASSLAWRTTVGGQISRRSWFAKSPGPDHDSSACAATSGAPSTAWSAGSSGVTIAPAAERRSNSVRSAPATVAESTLPHLSKRSGRGTEETPSGPDDWKLEEEAEHAAACPKAACPLTHRVQNSELVHEKQLSTWQHGYQKNDDHKDGKHVGPCCDMVFGCEAQGCFVQAFPAFMTRMRTMRCNRLSKPAKPNAMRPMRACMCVAGK